MNQDFIVFGQPLIEQEEIDEVVDSLTKCWLGTGPKVSQFEEQFKQYKEVKHAAAVGSCTAGLFLSLTALDIGPGDEVITTAMTFVATVNSIVHTGATPVLCDIDPLTWNIDPNEIESKITSNTKAIIPVHFAGRPCDMDAIMYLARKYQLYVIEDCAHAIETEYKGKKAGTIGDFGVFSFYATKNITTGEGGMVISNNKDKVDRIKKLALHGLSVDAWKRFSDDGYNHYYVDEPGYKYNMMDLQAAIGIHQLRKVTVLHGRRERLWQNYLKELEGTSVQLPTCLDADSTHGLHLFQIVLDKDSNISRDDLLVHMTENKIGVGVHYLSIPRHPFYSRLFHETDFPNSSHLGRNTLSLPLMPSLTKLQQDIVISVLKNAI